MNRPIHRLLLAALCLLFTVWVLGASAADDRKKKPKITPPPPPEQLKHGEDIEPQVTIVNREWAQIQEFSINGQVYAVRIDPTVGPPYWLYDSNGDGKLETRFETGNDMPDIRQWKLLEW